MGNALTVDQHTYLQRWIRAKQPKGCPCCGDQRFTVQAFIVTEITAQPYKPTDLAGLAAMYRGAILPLAGIECANCGDTRFVNLIIAGILNSELKSLPMLPNIALREVAPAAPRPLVAVPDVTPPAAAAPDPSQLCAQPGCPTKASRSMRAGSRPNTSRPRWPHRSR